MTNDPTASYHPPAEPIDELAEEFVARYRNGERPRVEEYADQHPALASDIRRLFPMLVALEQCGSTVDAPTDSFPPADAPGQQVGGYTLVRRIGEGGMGVVYEAVQEPLGRPVALKFLKGFGTVAVRRERFLREAQAVARLHHPNIVAVYGTGDHQGVPYFAMQLIRGKGLDTRIETARGRDDRPQTGDIDRAVRLVVQVADALTYAHLQGVTHRDIKPSNLLVDAADKVWVADFGLARFDGDNHLTAPGGIVGTRQYMAPEQYHGWADPRSDVYALGVTLYELVTGAPAFDGKTPQEVLRKVLEADVPPPRRMNPAVHPDLEAVIQKAMAVEPAHRYQTAAAFADDLSRYVAGSPVSARRLSTARKTFRWAKRNPVAAVLAAAVVLLMTTVTVLSAWAALRFNRLKNDAETARHTIEGQRDTISKQLDDKQIADEAANAQLSRLLLRSAQAEISRRSGGKREALTALGEAAALSRQLNLPAEYRSTLRREYIAALTHTDLVVVPDRSWAIPGFVAETPIAAFAPDGRMFALPAKAGAVSVRSADRNEELFRLTGPPEEKTPPPISILRFSRRGKYLAAKCGTQIRVWDVAGRKVVGQYGPVAALSEPFDLLADESGVVWVDGRNVIRIRRFAEDREQQLTALPVRPTLVRCDPTGRRIAYGTLQTPAVFLYDLPSEQTTKCPLPAGVDRLAWAPDGVRFAAAGADKSAVFVVSSRSPTAPPLVLKGHDGRVVRLAFHPHEDVLATCSWDQTVRVWDLTRPDVHTHFAFSLSYQALEFTADGKYLWPGVSDGRLWMWEWMRPTAGQMVLGSRWDNLWGAAVSPDGKTVAGMSENGLEVWDVTRPQRPVVLAPSNPASPEEFARLFEFGVDWDEVEVGQRVRDALAQKALKPIRVLSGRRVRFSERGDALLFGAVGGVTRLSLQTDSDGTLRVTDRDTWTEPGGEDHAWSNDGTLVAVVPRVGPIAVYDTTTRKRVAAVERHGWTGSLAFSPDNRWLATGAWPQSGAKVWDLSTGKAVATFKTTGSSHPTFSSDGRWVVIGEGEGYQFYRTDDWTAAHKVSRIDCGHKPATAAFAPDGKTVAVWTQPGQISLLNPADGSEYAVLPVTARFGSIDANGELQFTADGTKLVVVADRRRIQVWDIAQLRGQLASVGLDWSMETD